MTNLSPDYSAEYMTFDMRTAAHAYEGEYASLAADYITARDTTVQTIASEAMLLQQAPAYEPNSHEIVTWRIDGTVATEQDNTYDFASRARLRVTAAGGSLAVPEGLIVPEPVALQNILPPQFSRAVRQLGKAGMYICGMEYRTPLLEEITDTMPMAKFNMTQITLDRAVYSANPNDGDVIVFPHLPEYMTLLDEAYSQFCADKSGNLPVNVEVHRQLAAAAEQDRKAAHQPPSDNLVAYRELSAACPDGMGSKIEALAAALYAFNPGSDRALSPELARVLMDPLTGMAAELALLNKWSYMKQISGREYTAPLTAQLRQVREFAGVFHAQMQSAVQGDAASYELQIENGLRGVEQAVRKAESFAAHLSVPETFSLTGSEWRVRPR